MKQSLFLSILASVLLVTACNINPTPLDIDIPEPEQQLVVSSFSIPPQELALIFSRTFSALYSQSDSTFLDDDDLLNEILVDSGLVILRYVGINDTLKRLAPGVYVSLNAQQIDNERYTLLARDYKTGKSISAETVLLPPVPLDSVESTLSPLGGGSDSTYSFEARFNDPAGVANYYLLTYTNFSDFEQVQSGYTAGVFNFKPAQFAVFTDQNQGDGNDINYNPLYSGAKNDTLVVALSNITKDYYDYLTAYKRSGNLFSQLIGEPINLPSNVQGGYGYFAMIRPKIKLVILR